ncbi:unnamed protein product [Mycena citricolor]|uniref:DUF7514 domain-containing protein n=1 Tax=Mycena citricolor TaxID=2018698 RepID=A0AAD2HWM9_9AGAR|nr:unnamed protein product [Mycena citricolor]
MAPNFFGCDACGAPIPATHPRVQCVEPRCGVDLCAVCALGERAGTTSAAHQASHRVRVWRQSGGGAQQGVVSAMSLGLVASGQAPQMGTTNAALPSATPPPPAQAPSRTVSPALPVSVTGQQSPSQQQQQQQQSFQPPPKRISTAGPPLPSRTRMSMSMSMGGLNGASAPGGSAPGGSAPGGSAPGGSAPGGSAPGGSVPEGYHSSSSPPPPTYGGTSSGGTSSSASGATAAPAPGGGLTGWAPFFTPEMDGTPVYKHLMGTIFAALDPRRTGALQPEVFSRFLADLGYVGQENTWTASLVATIGTTKEEAADAALRRAWDLFSVEYTLAPRPRDPRAPPDALTQQIQSIGGAFARAFTQSTSAAQSASGGQMPMITLRGFMDVMALEILCEPSRHWGAFARLTKNPAYGLAGLVAAWGELPRSVIPEEADPRMLERVRKVQAFAQERAQIELQAAHAKASIEAQGRQNALDLISGPRYRPW